MKERVVSENPVESNIQLTTFHDDTEKVDTLVNNQVMQVLRNPDPYPDQGLTRILSRVYKVADIVWSTADATGDVLTVLLFPDLLFQENNIMSKIAQFHYFRAGVKVGFRINGTMFNYGKLLISWLPHYASNLVPNVPYPIKDRTLFQRANNNPVELSANTAATIEIDVPWITPYLFIDLEQYPSIAEWTSFICQMTVSVLNPLRSAGENPVTTLNLSVFASFIEPQVAGLTSETFVTAAMFKDRKRRWKVKDVDNDTFKTPTVDQVVNDFVAQMEQREKSSNGVIVSRSTDSGDMAVHANLPIIGDVASAGADVISLISKLANTLGLCKPATVESSRMVNLQLLPDICHGMGLDMSNTLSMDPENKLAVDNRIFSQDDSVHDIYHIARTPSLLAVVLFDATAAVGDIIFAQPLHPTVVSAQGPDIVPTYLSYVSLPFVYWRGSLKLRFSFSASKFTTARLRISWAPSNITGAFVTSGGDFVSRIIDINSDTEEMVTVPYLQYRPGLPVLTYGATPTSDTTLGTLVVSIVNPIRVIDQMTTTDVFMNVWIAAGEDFELYKPRQVVNKFVPRVIPDADKRGVPAKKKKIVVLKDFVAQVDVREKFRSTFPPLMDSQFMIQHKIVCGERVSDLRCLMHRYTYLQSTSNITAGAGLLTYPVWPVQGDNTASNQLLYWAYLYMFWRGTVRYKTFVEGTQAQFARFTLTTEASPDVTPLDQSSDAYNATTFLSSAYKPAAEWSCPWYHELLCEGTFGSPLRDSATIFPSFHVNKIAYTNATAVAVAIGDDFTFGHLSSPPELIAI